MKRSFPILIYLLGVILIISGCKGTEQEIYQPTIPPTQTATPEPTIPPSPTIQLGNIKEKVMVNDLERSYLLHIPANLDDQQPVPVVFAFHGLDGAASDMQVAGLDVVSDQSNFLVVYPEAVDKRWNLGEGLAEEEAFIMQILTELNKIAPVDPKRIYATGFSMGGMISYQIACDIDIFAAVAPVAGSMNADTCQPSHAVSVLHIHGLRDINVPYSSSVGGVEQGIAAWVQINGCTDVAQVDEFCQSYVGQNKYQLDNCTEENPTVAVIRTTYDSCLGGSAVELYTISSLAHTWPTNYIPSFGEIIWEFFASHPKP